jgi:hypothetical protein
MGALANRPEGMGNIFGASRLKGAEPVNSAPSIAAPIINPMVNPTPVPPQVPGLIGSMLGDHTYSGAVPGRPEAPPLEPIDSMRSGGYTGGSMPLSTPPPPPVQMGYNPDVSNRRARPKTRPTRKPSSPAPVQGLDNTRRMSMF